MLQWITDYASRYIYETVDKISLQVSRFFTSRCICALHKHPERFSILISWKNYDRSVLERIQKIKDWRVWSDFSDIGRVTKSYLAWKDVARKWFNRDLVALPHASLSLSYQLKIPPNKQTTTLVHCPLSILQPSRASPWSAHRGPLEIVHYTHSGSRFLSLPRHSASSSASSPSSSNVVVAARCCYILRFGKEKARFLRHFLSEQPPRLYINKRTDRIPSRDRIQPATNNAPTPNSQRCNVFHFSHQGKWGPLISHPDSYCWCWCLRSVVINKHPNAWRRWATMMVKSAIITRSVIDFTGIFHCNGSCYAIGEFFSPFRICFLYNMQKWAKCLWPLEG